MPTAQPAAVAGTSPKPQVIFPQQYQQYDGHELQDNRQLQHYMLTSPHPARKMVRLSIRCATGQAKVGLLLAGNSQDRQPPPPSPQRTRANLSFLATAAFHALHAPHSMFSIADTLALDRAPSPALHVLQCQRTKFTLSNNESDIPRYPVAPRTIFLAHVNL